MRRRAAQDLLRRRSGPPASRAARASAAAGRGGRARPRRRRSRTRPRRRGCGGDRRPRSAAARCASRPDDAAPTDGRTPAVHTIDAVGDLGAVAQHDARVRRPTRRACRCARRRRDARARAARTSTSRFLNVGSTRSPPSSITIRTSDGGNSGYSCGSTSRTSSAERARELDAGRPAADDAERQQAPAFRRVGRRPRHARGSRARGCGVGAPRRDP